LCDEFVSVPKVIEAGYRSDGANYIIEEEKFGLHATPAVLNSLTKREQADFCAHLAVFLERLHNSAPAFAKGRKLCPDVTMSRTYADSNYFVRLIYQYYSFQSPSLIHGDLAPRNVLLDVNKGVINVIDWGNACCDYPFAEFDKMYSDMYPFGRNISNAIADKYCQLREARYVVEQRQAAETIKSRNSAKQSAKPDRTCRLPMSMRSGGHTR
jgi:aminoglycoside phosphotransferase (APT) family kinase protein